MYVIYALTFLFITQTTQISGASRAFNDSDTDLILNDAEINLAENSHHQPGGDGVRRTKVTQPNSTQVGLYHVADLYWFSSVL